MREQINLQVSFNPKNRSHMELLSWINTQTTNKSSFIRESVLMRMVGMFGVRGVELQEFKQEEIDVNEVLRLIQI